MRYALYILGTTCISLAVVVLFYLYFPLSILDRVSENLGSTITVISGSDTLSASRTTINDNFAALNATKLEGTGSNNSLAAFTGSNSIAATSSTVYIGSLVATTTATSTYTGGIQTAAVQSGYVVSTGNASSTFVGSISSLGMRVTSYFDALSAAIMQIPSSASVSLSTIGQIGIDWTSDLFMYRSDDGTTHVVEDGIDGCFPVASTSPTHFSSSKSYGQSGGTTTYAFDFLHKRTLSQFYCKSDNNSLLVQVGNGTATSAPYFYCTPGGYSSTSIGNNTYTSRQRMFFSIGSATTTPNTVSICPYITITAD